MKRLAQRIRLWVLMTFATLFLASGCAAWSWNEDVKPVVRTVDGVARELCALFYGDAMGISLDDAARVYCSLREQYAPWIDVVLAGAQAGGLKALQPPSGFAPATPSSCPSGAALEPEGTVPPLTPSPLPSASAGAPDTRL